VSSNASMRARIVAGTWSSLLVFMTALNSVFPRA
jgi:hypothetical protein